MGAVLRACMEEAVVSALVPEASSELGQQHLHSSPTSPCSAIPTIDAPSHAHSERWRRPLRRLGGRRDGGRSRSRAAAPAARCQGVHTAEILLLAATAPAARELVLRAVLNIVKLSEVMRPLPQQCGDGLEMDERRREMWW